MFFLNVLPVGIKRRLAYTSNSAFILDKLASSTDDEETLENISHNPHAKPETLINIPNDFIK